MALYLKQAKQPPKEDLARVRETVREILDKVRSEGEAGVRYYSSRFDDWSPGSAKGPAIMRTCWPTGSAAAPGSVNTADRGQPPFQPFGVVDSSGFYR